MTAAILAMAATAVLAQKATGNLAPSGAHYDLNIIGLDKNNKPPLIGTNRHVIYVPLYTPGVSSGVDTDPVPGNDIWLIQAAGLDFTVCDGNAFDTAYDCNGVPLVPPGFTTSSPAQGATFELPCNTEITAATGTTLVPCTTGGSAEYEVWARVVGKPTPPGGGVTVTTCAYDFTIPTAPVLVCSTNNTGLLVKTKSNKFVNVTNALTSIVATVCTTTAGVTTCTPTTTALFQAPFQFFFWDYDNNGAKVLQLRFYLE
jgi:hypothetical protein